MARLVRDLLRLSRMEYNQTDWNKILINPCVVLTETLEKMNMRIKEKNQILEFNLSSVNCTVLYDKDGLEQIFQNIISNAIKYTPENGTISISCINKFDKIIFKIKDNGIGIPSEDLDRVFERFYRVDKARSR